MTMGFQAADKSELAGIAKGDRVEFELDPNPDKEGNYVIRKIEKR
jgi:Cu/Ag efflux protein CusF